MSSTLEVLSYQREFMYLKKTCLLHHQLNYVRVTFQFCRSSISSSLSITFPSPNLS